MKRTGRLTRTARLRPRKRTASEYARVYGSKARVEWIKAQPCIYCVSLHPLLALGVGESQNCHTVTGGTGRKAGYETIIPLCHSHHRRYDEHRYPFDMDMTRDAMKAAALGVQAAWLLQEDAQP